MPSRFVALVPAAGSGARYAGDELKQMMAIHGLPLFAWTVQRLEACGASEIVVAVPEVRLRGAQAVLSGSRARCVAGGANRQESVRVCLEAVPGDDSDLILVHDGVRPAVAERDVRTVVDAAAETGAAILGRAVHDTLKKVDHGRVVGTVERSDLFRAETPQVFRREILVRAFERAEHEGFVGTDEASLVERLEGVEIRAVEAVAPNPKLTHQRDLPFVESLLEL
jgi:2-C-methyl-D-erythritol 4-phosphate cytidylyltransferase